MHKMRTNWTLDEYREYIRTGKEPDDNPPIQTANMEPIARSKQMEAQGYPRCDTPVHVHVKSIRRRLADADGISAKAVIDGLVHLGILPDDKPEFVKEVSYSQEKGKEEKTIIEIRSCDA